MAASRLLGSKALGPLLLPLLAQLLALPAPAGAARPRARAGSRWQSGALLTVGGNATAPACLRSQQGHPSEITCPEACPFLRAEPTQMCGFSCVPAGECPSDDPLASFANPETMRCEGCKAVACAECRSAWKCAKCQEGFALSRFGTCISPYRGFWWFVYLFLLLMIIPVVYYIVMLPFRPQVNGAIAEKALEFREECKQCDPVSGLPYKLWRNLGGEYLSGIGVMLHFRWQQMVIVWSILVCLLYFVLSFFFKTRPSAIKHDPGSPKAFAACEYGVVQQEHEFVAMEQTYFFATLAVYLLSTAGALLLAIHQRRTANRTMDEVISMGDYAVLATGFPIRQGTAKCEDEIQAFFQNWWPDLDIVGISVCWNLRSSGTLQWVEEENEKDIFTLDCEFDESESGDDSRKNYNKHMLTEDREDRKCMHTRLECLDTIFGIGPGLISDGKEKIDKTPEEIQAKLQSLETTGSAFVVFGTERQCKQAMERARTSAVKFDNEHTIKFEHTDVEPETVIWGGFGVSLLVFLRNLVLGNVVIFTAVIILDIFFYAPYVVYIFIYADVKGMVGGGLIQGTLLGLLITVCNQIIYLIIGVVADKCGFRFARMHRQFYMVQYTVAIFFNTCVDLWTVMLLAQGFSVQEVASKMQDPANAMGENGILSPKAIAEQPTVQRSVYIQLLTYLFPGCLLIPFLLEPLAVGFLTYLLPTWLVRSRPEVDVQEAEKRLAASDYDVSRYGDILVNVMLCVLTLAFTYRDLYQIFAWLTVSLVIIYCWDHYRFLRCTRKQVISSPLMEFTAHWLMAVPCAILAAVVVFHAWAAMDDGFLEPMAELWRKTLREIVLDDITRSYLRLARRTILWYMLAAFLGHLTVHFALLIWFVPYNSSTGADHDDMVPYKETAAYSPCTWFNANPVHTLRSKYIYKHSPPCIPYETGKAYLLKMNPSIGQFFQQSNPPKILKNRSKSFGFAGGV